MVIMWLIRKDHLQPRKALSWIGLAIAIAILGLFPELSDWLAHELGISYPPTLVLLAGIAVLLIKLLMLDIARTREHQQVLILSQKLSVLERLVDEQRQHQSCEARQDSDGRC